MVITTMETNKHVDEFNLGKLLDYGAHYGYFTRATKDHLYNIKDVIKGRADENDIAQKPVLWE